MSAFAASDEPDSHDLSYNDPDPATTIPPIPQDPSERDASHSRSRSNNPLLGNDNSQVSELEQEVLDEYSRLLRNVNQVSCIRHFTARCRHSFYRQLLGKAVLHDIYTEERNLTDSEISN